MSNFIEIVRSGWDGITLYPLRSFVTVLSVLVALVPLLSGLAIVNGIERDSRSSLSGMGDLSVTARAFGRPSPIPESVIPLIRKVDGVSDCFPRVNGTVYLGVANERALLIGTAPERFPVSRVWVDGRLPAAAAMDEITLGCELARRLRLRVGDVLPPFYRSRSGDHLATVVGILRPDAPLWTSRLILTMLEPAMRILDQPRAVTDIQVRCDPARLTQVGVSLAGLQHSGPEQLSVAIPDAIHGQSQADLDRRSAFFSIHLLLAALCAIWIVMVTSGAGMSERSHEVGLLKATGWATDEILLRSLSESGLLSLLSYGLSVLLALIGLQFVKGWGLAPLFVSGVEMGSTLRIPYALTPLALGSTALATLAVVLSGSLYSAWKAAITPPMRAIRE